MLFMERLDSRALFAQNVQLGVSNGKRLLLTAVVYVCVRLLYDFVTILGWFFNLVETSM